MTKTIVATEQVALVESDAIVSGDGGVYPRCLAGAGACPPEDVGGTHGYQEFVRAIRDPDSFSPDSILFEDPRKRWQIAFEDR